MEKKWYLEILILQCRQMFNGLVKGDVYCICALFQAASLICGSCICKYVKDVSFALVQVFSLSVTEIGTLLCLGPRDSFEFFHDPFKGRRFFLNSGSIFILSQEIGHEIQSSVLLSLLIFCLFYESMQLSMGLVFAALQQMAVMLLEHMVKLFVFSATRVRSGRC